MDYGQLFPSHFLGQVQTPHKQSLSPPKLLLLRFLKLPTGLVNLSQSLDRHQSLPLRLTIAPPRHSIPGPPHDRVWWDGWWDDSTWCRRLDPQNLFSPLLQLMSPRPAQGRISTYHYLGRPICVGITLTRTYH